MKTARSLISIALLGIMFFEARSAPAQSAAPATQPQQAWKTIHNDFYWVDQNGDRVLTRSGCLAKFNGLYYWYGGTQGDLHRAQYCYTSPDLVHWTSKGVVIRFDVETNRIDVIYNKTTRQYVMVMKYDGNGAHLGIATSEKPEGPFEFKSQTLVDNARMGDSSVFVDDDGTAYLCYVSWAVGTNAQHGIYRLSPDYLTLDKRLFLWDIRSREAPHIMKRNGIYYYGTSRTAGIQSSGTAYYTATTLEGPWSAPESLPTPGSNNSWDSQVDMIVPVQGTEGTIYLYFGDRWVKDVAQGRNGDYIFLPLEFNGDKPILNYYQDWEINLAAGTWRKFDPARNLAANKPVTASSEESTNRARNVTQPKAFQDYVKTFWQSGADETQWIMVDLEKPTEINRVILKWNANAAKDFKVQTSNDASNWSDVFSTALGAAATVTDETFPTTTARYVRVNATQRAPAPRGRGAGRGLGARGRGATQPATRSGATQPAASFPARGAPPAAPTGYSLFDFMVLKD